MVIRQSRRVSAILGYGYRSLFHVGAACAALMVGIWSTCLLRAAWVEALLGFAACYGPTLVTEQTDTPPGTLR